MLLGISILNSVGKKLNLITMNTKEQAEKILKEKLKNIKAIDNADYTFNKIIEAMEEHANNAYEQGLKEGYSCMPKNIR